MAETVELFGDVERTQEIQAAVRLLQEADQDVIEQLPPLYREKAEEARDRFGTREA